MSVVAMGSVGIVNIDDGNGIDHVDISYAIHTSASDPPGNPITDGGVIVVDIDGRPLTDGSWQSTVPEVPNGYYLWTRTITVYSSGDFSIAYSVGYTGEDGAQGEQGVSIVAEKEQWYLSNSSSSLVGGSWSYTEPTQIPEGKYLWGRFEFSLSNGQTNYSDAVYRSTIGGLINLTDDINRKITQKIWQSDITSGISNYDSTTAQTIRDRVTQTETDIDGITTRVSAAESTLLTKADGSTVAALQQTVSENEQTAEGFRQTVESSYAKLTDIDNMEIGARNLVLKSDVEKTSKNTVTNYNLSDYGITILPGQEIMISADLKCTVDNTKLDCYIRTDSGSWNVEISTISGIGTSYDRYKVSAEVKPFQSDNIVETIAFRTTSASGSNTSATYSIKNVKVEIGNKATTWSPAPEDILAYADDTVESAKSEIEQTTDSISLEVSKKVGNDEVISKINQSSENITIQASKVDLIGNVTFNMLDSAAQTRITNVESSSALANDKANIGLGMKTNYSNFNTAEAGECYLHGYTNGVAADVDGYVYWNDRKITVPKKMLNPNNILPYYTTVYIVLRLTNGTATTGTLYMVWYNSGWKYAVTPTPSAVGGTWTWAEATDIVLGQFVEPSNEGQIVNAYLYNPPRNASHIQSTGSNSYQYAKPSVDWVSTNGAPVLTAKSIINNWATDATSATTTIKGGLIQTHTILAEALATNAVMSTNYSSGVQDSDVPTGYYSTSGSFLDLATGNFYTPNFSVVSGNVYVNGEVNMLSGQIGDVGNSYWEVGTKYGEDWSDKAAIIAHGNALIQTGQFTLEGDKLSSFNNGDYVHVGNEWYDYAIQVPDRNATGQNAILKNDFLYIRKISSEPDEGTMAQDWTYLFKVDKDGNVYENGTKLSDKYATISDVGSAYLPTSGGTVNGNVTITGTLTATASEATKLANARNLNVSLSTTSNSGKVTFDGAADKTLGVTGTLGVGNGGTGKASWTQWGIVYASANNTLDQIGAGTSGQILKSNGSAAPTWVDQSTLSVASAVSATQDASGNVITTTYRRLDDDDFDTIDVVDLDVGNIVVTGSARFTNGLYGDLIGNITGSAESVTSNLKIQLNGGTTEGTNQFTYNGSAVKNIDITKSSIGLGNVENTAISTWAGSSNLTTTKVGTLAAAATKAVDSSISESSTSANLPTSEAVASFVEGKGYVTSSGVTSVRVQATSPVVSSTNTEETSTLDTTISLANAYGDTKNPYGNKTANYVLAGPSSGNAAAPAFRKLVAADIPSITKSKISDFPTTWALANITGADDLQSIEGLSGTSGFLKKTGANAWTLDTNTYVTSSGVTSITLSAGTGISLNATGAITTTGTRTITNTGVISVSESTNDGKLSVTTGSTTSDVTLHGVVTGVSVVNDVLTVSKSDGTSVDHTINITGQVVSGATILTDSDGQGLSVGSASQPVYFADGVPSLANTIPTIKLNNSNTTSPSFYAPTGAGTNGQVLKSSGSGAPSWVNQSTLSVGSASALVLSAAVGSSTKPVYFKSDGTPEAITSIAKLNGTVTAYPEFYAPTGAGTSGQYLKSSGNGAPTWETFSKSTVGLGNVDNTSDADKPISTATQNALDQKAHKNNGIYVVKGTQTAATPSWTGNIDVPELYDGLTIAYYLPYAGTSSSATLNLTLSDGETTTGAIPVYYTGNTRATTHCAAGSTIILTYWGAGSIAVSGTETTTGSWRRSDYTVTNTNTYDRRFMNDTRVYAGANGIKTYSLIMQDSTGKWQSLTTTAGNEVTHTKNPSGFRPDTILRYAYSNNIAANALTSNDYIYETGEMDFRYSSNCASTLTARKSVYIVGTMVDGYFYLADDWYSQDLPTTEDGKVYIYIGEAFSGYQVVYTATHPMYMFKNGRIIRYSDITKTDLGLSNVDNTADEDKSVNYANTAGSASSATTASKFSSARTITLTGDATGSASSDGTSGWSISTSVNHADSADESETATKDGSGNVITSTYVNLTGIQTISGAKTFSAVTDFTNTTASTSKSTGAVKVSGGVGVAGRISANETMIGDHVVLSYNTTTESLDFIFS